MKCLRRHEIENFVAPVILLLALNLGVVVAQSSSPTPTPPPSPSPTAASPTPTPSQTTGSIDLSPATLDFKDHDVGTTTYAEAIIVKNGKGAVSSIGVAITGETADFVIGSNTCTGVGLEPGGQCVVSVKFSPTDKGVRQATLMVNYKLPDNSSGSKSATLSGTGWPPALLIAPATLDFGQQIVGSTSVVHTITLTAGPADVVKIPSVAAGGDFTASPATCPQLERASSCTLSVSFAPKHVGPTTGSLTITAIINDKTSPKIVALKGEAVQQCPGPGFSIWRMLPVLILVFVYLLALVFVRWHMIARPARFLLRSQIDAVDQRVAAISPLTSPPTVSSLAPIRQLLKTAKDLIGDRGFWDWHTWSNYLFWSRGQEMAAWGCVHEAEEQLVFFLPVESIRAALERAESDLREAGTPAALELAARIHEALAAAPPLPPDRCRPALEQVRSFLMSPAGSLTAEVSRLLDPMGNATADECRLALEKVLAFLNPQVSSLEEQINQLINSSPPASPDQLIPLLRQAADLLQTQAQTLAKKLKQADPGSPPQLTAAQWRPLLLEVQEYFTPHAALIEQVDQALALDPVVPLDRWRALLNEALGFLYNRTDNSFANLVSWQNKTVWLVGCSLLLIVSLAAVLQHGVLFLVGATGGLLSRLGRSLNREDVPTDYGASWSTLFLSPVVGALAGWASILLVILGVELNILGAALKFDWCNPYNPVALGVAFLFGFSERAFDGILTQLEQRVNTPSAAQPSLPATISIGTPANLPAGTVGQAYSQTLNASGGTTPYTWTLKVGKLPTGLALDPKGQITGTLTSEAKGSTKFTLQVTDAAGKLQSQEFTIVVS